MIPGQLPRQIQPGGIQQAPGGMPAPGALAPGIPQTQPLQNPGQPQIMGTQPGMINPGVSSAQGGVNAGELGMPWAQRFNG